MSNDRSYLCNEIFRSKDGCLPSRDIREDCSTHFLHCNAHFLLGIADAIEASLKQIIETEFPGMKLGRDKSEKYSRFLTSKETPALRLVRLAAECLGPRGDEKSGAREEWLGHLQSVFEGCIFSSYRTNRFNNVPHNCTALIKHKDDIIDLIENKCSHANLKLASVLDGILDNNIVSMIAAVACFNYIVTKPFWDLMQGDTHSYYDFPPFVKKLKTFL